MLFSHANHARHGLCLVLGRGRDLSGYDVRSGACHRRNRARRPQLPDHDGAFSPYLYRENGPSHVGDHSLDHGPSSHVDHVRDLGHVNDHGLGRGVSLYHCFYAYAVNCRQSLFRRLDTDLLPHTGRPREPTGNGDGDGAPCLDHVVNVRIYVSPCHDDCYGTLTLLMRFEYDHHGCLSHRGVAHHNPHHARHDETNERNADHRRARRPYRPSTLVTFLDLHALILGRLTVTSLEARSSPHLWLVVSIANASVLAIVA